MVSREYNLGEDVVAGQDSFQSVMVIMAGEMRERSDNWKCGRQLAEARMLSHPRAR